MSSSCKNSVEKSKRSHSRCRANIGVRDLAQPIKRTGSLGSAELSSSSSFMASALGRELHERIQARILTENPNYQKELLFKCSHDHGDLNLEISGRCDGVFDLEEELVLEEIKTTSHLNQLATQIKEREDHPYRLQILTYGFLQNASSERPFILRLRLVCRQTLKEQLLVIEYDNESYHCWLKARCQQILGELLEQKKLIKVRKRLSKAIQFPFDQPRPQQEQLIGQVAAAIRLKKHLMLQAPTGLGKTAGVLLPALQESLAVGSPVVFLTPKNSQFKAVIDLVKILHKNRLKLKVLILTAKRKACLNEEFLCHESTCRYASNYYDKVDHESLGPRDKKKSFWGQWYFKDMAEAFEVCPYEVSLERLSEADLIVADYNYIFSMRANLIDRYQHPYVPRKKPTLVIDEAHNLYSRVMDNFSPELNLSEIEDLENKLKDIDEESDSYDLCKKLKSYITRTLSPMKAAGRKQGLINLNIEFLHELQDDIWQATLGRLYESRPLGPDDGLAQIHQMVGDFVEVYEMLNEIGATKILANFEAYGWRIKLISCDISQIVKERLTHFHAVTAFSATLKPFDFYARISGFLGDKLKTVELTSPFPRKNKKIMIIPQIQTSYRRRSHHIERIQEVISRIIATKPGHYLVFFPSYRFLNEVAATISVDSRWRLIKQQPTMRAHQIDEIIAEIDIDKSPRLVFAVQGGSLAEGIDLKGRGVCGVFIVGPAIPNYDLERELIKDYYEANFSSGEEFAYIFPAMAKSIQAAGRVVRDASEKGLIILLDERFLHSSYQQSYPSDWYDDSPSELLSDAIIRDITSFWADSSSDENPKLS